MPDEKKLTVIQLPGVVDSFSAASFARRLKIAAGDRVPEIAAKIGVAPSTIYKWIAGRFEPGLVKLEEFAAITKVSLTWLVTGEGPRDAELAREHARLEGYAFVDLEPAGGKKPLVAFDAEGLHDLIRDSRRDQPETDAAKSPASTCLVAVRDDSMEPTIMRGDLVLADRACGLTDAEIKRAREKGRSVWEGVYVFQSDKGEGGLVVRRLHYRLDGTMVISCDNSKYPDESYPAKAKTRPVAIGRVIWRGGRI